MRNVRKPVERPEKTILIHHSNGTDYVFLTIGFLYRKHLKRSEPVRVSIGKLNEDGMLIPNKNYDLFVASKNKCKTIK